MTNAIALCGAHRAAAYMSAATILCGMRCQVRSAWRLQPPCVVCAALVLQSAITAALLAWCAVAYHNVWLPKHLCTASLAHRVNMQ